MKKEKGYHSTIFPQEIMKIHRENLWKAMIAYALKGYDIIKKINKNRISKFIRLINIITKNQNFYCFGFSDFPSIHIYCVVNTNYSSSPKLEAE